MKLISLWVSRGELHSFRGLDADSTSCLTVVLVVPFRPNVNPSLFPRQCSFLVHCHTLLPKPTASSSQFSLRSALSLHVLCNPHRRYPFFQNDFAWQY